jgi:hypothetical protein
VLSRGNGMGSLLICVQWYHFHCWTCIDRSEMRHASRYERETQLYGLFYRYVVCSCIPPSPALHSTLLRDASVRSLLITADGWEMQALLPAHPHPSLHVSAKQPAPVHLIQWAFRRRVGSGVRLAWSRLRCDSSWWYNTALPGNIQIHVDHYAVRKPGGKR